MPLCNHPYCNKHASFAYNGQHPQYCTVHKLMDMVNVRQPNHHTGCKNHRFR